MQLLVPILLLLGACSIVEVPATTKELKDKIEAQLPVIEKGKGQVCFLRLNKFTGSAVSPDIYVDGNKIKDLSNDSYFCVNLTPNDHFITAKMIFVKDMNIFISIYEGKRKYVLLTYDINKSLTEINRGKAIGYLYTIINNTNEDVNEY